MNGITLLRNYEAINIGKYNPFNQVNAQNYMSLWKKNVKIIDNPWINDTHTI